MKFGRESEYGLKGLLFLAREPAGRILPLLEIAKATDLPQSFLAKIFQKFVQHGVLKSYRGAIRGYALARPPKEIKAREVLEAIEGPDLFERCIFWNDRCGDVNPCALHDGWKQVKPQFVQYLGRTTLHDLAQSRGWVEVRPARRGVRSR